MTVLGHWMMVVALATSAVSAIGYWVMARGSHQRLLRPGLFASLSALFVILASAVLLTQLLLHDFSSGYVFSYSDRSLSTFYLISSFYAGQEGSFLFWALCSAVIALVVARALRNSDIAPWALGVYMTVQTALLLLVLVKSPFRSLWEMFPQAIGSHIPGDGRGLNPLLQNFWMVIHPPVLFLGFAGMAAPFSLALGGLFKGDPRALIQRGLPFVLSATLILGLGIMLGAYWAYGVLGWGGYWGWDPVENSSLVPWLTGVALLHTLIAQSRTGKYVRTNFSLALVTFFLVIYSTFLTRSGILGDASVHAFTDPGAAIYWVLLSLLAVIAGISVAALALRWRSFRPEESASSIFTRESFLGYGAIAVLLSAVVVLFGTSLPIFSTTRVEPAFYDTANLPLAAVMVLLIGFSLLVQWEYQEGREMVRSAFRGLAFSVIAGIGLYLAGIRELRFLALAIASVFALIVNLEVAVGVARGNWRFLGGKLAHIGLALFLIGAITTGRYARSERVALLLHRPQQVLGSTMTFEGERRRPDGKSAFVVKVVDGGKELTLEPVMFDAGEQGIMKNPDIASFLTRDLYLSPLSFEEAPGPPESYRVLKGQSVAVGKVAIRFTDFEMTRDHSAMSKTPGGGVTVGALLEVEQGNERERLTPVAMVEPGRRPTYTKVRSRLLDADIQLTGIDIGDSGPASVELDVERGGTASSTGVLIVEASIKPFILFLWVGTVVMFSGFGLAMVRRMKEGVR
ncbi:MAG: cytochrome c biogenesis protein CcsA [Bacteroidota bacterium]